MTKNRRVTIQGEEYNLSKTYMKLSVKIRVSKFLKLKMLKKETQLN